MVAIFKLSHELNDSMDLKWITGFVDAELQRNFDQDNVGIDLFGRENDYEGFSWSTELRLEVSEESYDFIAGVLYAQDDQEQRNIVRALDFTASYNGVEGFLPPFPRGLELLNNERNFEVESLALFADYTWRVNDSWELIVGGRYTRDEITYELAASGIRPTSSDAAPGSFDFFQSFRSVPRPTVSGKNDFNDFAPRFVARYKVNDDTNIYGTVSKGYKAGGASVGNDTNSDDAPISVSFDEETLLNYEFGVKTELFDNRLRLNAALFRLEWDDLQLEAFRFLTTGNINSLFEQTINVEEAEATGLEVEFLAALTQSFSLSGGFGYLNSEIKSDTQAQITGGFIVDLQGLDLPRSPEFTANLVAENRWDMNFGEAWARLEYIYRDGQFSDVEALTYEQTRGRPIPDAPSIVVPDVSSNGFPFYTQDYELFNLYLGASFAKSKLDVTFYVKNLADKEYVTGTGENFGLAGIRVRPHPRTIGASFSYAF